MLCSALSPPTQLTLPTVAPVDDCGTLWYIVNTLSILAMGSNNGLFFIRVRAVYGNARWATTFFGFLWLVVFVTTCFGLFDTKVGVRFSSSFPSTRRLS